MACPLRSTFAIPRLIAKRSGSVRHNFEWVVEAVAEMAIRKAREHVPGRDNLSWGKFCKLR
jgi:hypothetical protein